MPISQWDQEFCADITFSCAAIFVVPNTPQLSYMEFLSVHDEDNSERLFAIQGSDIHFLPPDLLLDAAPDRILGTPRVP